MWSVENIRWTIFRLLAHRQEDCRYKHQLFSFKPLLSLLSSIHLPKCGLQKLHHRWIHETQPVELVCWMKYESVLRCLMLEIQRSRPVGHHRSLWLDKQICNVECMPQDWWWNKLGLSCAKLKKNLDYIKQIASTWTEIMPAKFDTLTAGWLAHCDYITCLSWGELGKSCMLNKPSCILWRVAGWVAG